MQDNRENEIRMLYEKMNKEAEASNYHLNSDMDFTMDLITGLHTNQGRYGYMSCPCRLAEKNIEADRDIICPCDYRDADLNDYDACYCGLYVSERVLRSEVAVRSIPDRRGKLAEQKQVKSLTNLEALANLPYPVWRCRVCGYLCAREKAPEKCPICKVTQDRFERFI